MPSRPRAIVYIDGFNLYYGLLRGTPHRWLDLSAFANTLLPAYDIASAVRKTDGGVRIRTSK